MKKLETLARVHTHTHGISIQNNKIIKNSVNKISAVSNIKNKELYIA